MAATSRAWSALSIPSEEQPNRISTSLAESWISSIVADKHAQGIIFNILGHEEMCRRVFRIALDYTKSDPTTDIPVAFSALVESYYWEQGSRPSIPVISNAVAFYAPPGHYSCSSLAHTYSSRTGLEWLILDVEAEDLSRIIPLSVFVAYAGIPARRKNTLDNLVEPMPLWVVTRGRLGVLVTQRNIEGLQHGNSEMVHRNGRLRRTIRVRIMWPGYVEWASQIRMDGDSVESNTFSRLVRQMQAKIRKFIYDHASIAGQNPRWAVGVGADQISAQDVILLGIVFVSEGVAIPVLKVRDGFVFANTSSDFTAEAMS